MLSSLALTFLLPGATVGGAATAVPELESVLESVLEPCASPAVVHQDERSLVQLDRRDGRLSFGREAADRARRFLAERDVEEADGAERAVDGPERLDQLAAALLALGASGDERDARALELHAIGIKLTLRRAATLALGDLGEAGLPALERLCARAPAGLEEALVLALERVPGERARRTLRALALEEPGEPGEPGSRRTALVEAARRSAAPETLVFAAPLRRLRYHWRWEAARRFGYVDGRRFEELALERLLADEAFLDRFVFAQADVLEPELVRPHVVEVLAQPPRPGVVRALMRSLPRALVALALSPQWRGFTPSEWQALLDRVEVDRAWGSGSALFERAAAAGRADPRLLERAMVLLVRSGGEPPGAWRRHALARPTPDLQRALLEAAGDSGDARRIPEVQALLARRLEPRLEPMGRLALARLGHEPSLEAVDAILAGGPSPEREALLGALARVAYDGSALALLARAAELPDLSARERERILLGYVEAQRFPDRDALRAWLRHADPTHPRVTHVVRGLSQGAEEADLELFRDLFPVYVPAPRRGDAQAIRDLDVELALALHGHRDPVGGTILRAALWGSDWNRSVVAGALIARRSGMHALLFEADTPPTRATDEDLRRVGFCIGEYAGLPAVEGLARRRDERDPVVQGALLGALAARSRGTMDSEAR